MLVHPHGDELCCFVSDPVVVEEEAKDEEAETIEMDESSDEDAMETDDAGAATSTTTDAMDTETQVSVKEKEAKESQAKKAPPVVSSGLPQSHQDLEALISTIHQTVTQSILPRLHKCLIARVRAPSSSSISSVFIIRHFQEM